MATSRSGWRSSIRPRPRRCSTGSRSRSGGSSAHRGSAAGWPATTCPAPGGSPSALPHPTERAYAWTFLADGLAASDRTAASAALDRALREIDSIDAADRIARRRAEPGRVDPAAGRADRARAGRRGLLAGRRPVLRPGDDPRDRLRPRRSLAGRGAAPLPLRPRRGEGRSSSRSRPSCAAARSATATTSSPPCSWP